ncbi:MAG: PfkB family carbohydrate kinase [Granulicella sp.]
MTVFGDFCVDAYWTLSEETSEISLETGLAVKRVSQQRYFLGGAGSVLANLAALEVGKIRAVGLAGTDLFGIQLRTLLTEAGANLAGFVSDGRVDTMVYAKPYLGASEDNRIDFGAFNSVPPDLLERLLRNLETAVMDSDVVVLNQQVARGISSPLAIKGINEIIARHPNTVFLVDARDHGALYKGALLKLNIREAAQRSGKEQGEIPAEEWAKGLVVQISEETGRPTFLTRGEAGIVVSTHNGAVVIPGLKVVGRTDAVGAGDAVVAALAAALAAGASPVLAATLANIAAMVTVKKIQTTGTATAAEILAEN